MSDKTIDRLTERAGHTPGPWTKDGSSIEAHWEDGETIQVASMNVSHWSTDPAYDDVELNRARNVRMRRETEANARLIAAAPELLEACRELLQLVPHFPEGGPSFRKVDRICQLVAKAEGQP